MNLGRLAKAAERVISDNSPAILTAIGVTGTLMTAYLTGKASMKAARILDRATVHGPVYATTREKVEAIWQLYIPSAVTAAMTVSAIIFSNRVGNRRAVALATAYSLSERAYEEYKSKVIEKFGEKKEQLIVDEIAQDRINKDSVVGREVIFTGGGDILCYEAMTGRYFQSDYETLRKAQNDINKQILDDSYASLSDFYDLIGLDHTTMSNDFGWNSDKKFEIRFSTSMSPDNRPCITVDYPVAPIRHFNRLS